MVKKIVLTGGPGGGKTTALDIFRREFRNGLVIVPEAATILFENGLKRGNTEEDIKRAQLGIYHLQKSLEAVFERSNPGSCLLCDRGTLDSIAYWPGPEAEFFESVNSNFQDELNRYDAVIFFETAAASGDSISSNNPQRVESAKDAIRLDRALQKIWSKHPNYHFIPSGNSFVNKVKDGLSTIENVVNC
jgi:predicted ATPase